MKNKYKIIVILFSIIIMLYLISNTLADYVSTASGIGNADFAKWNVTVGGVNVSSSGEHNVSTEIEIIPETVDGVMAGKIAPESKMVGTFTIDPNDTEVDIEYEVTVGEFFCIEESTYKPDIRITAVTINDNTVTLDSSGKFSGKIKLGDGASEIKIYAYWSSSEQDYLIGTMEVLQVGLPINVNIEQSAKKWQKILDLFKNDKLHIGDWVTYDAGTWTQEEVDSIKVGLNTSLVSANKSSSAPNTGYQFGGFTSGMSRNIGAVPYNSGTYMYAKMYDDGDTSNQAAISGWRVWDIDEVNNKIVLISAANPEDYYHPNATNSAYISQYILSGTQNSSWTGVNISDYTKRDWSMYNNTNYGAFDARTITLTDLNNWYSKYIVAGANTTTTATFQMIYSEPYIKYQNLIENHSYYWLSVAINATSMRNVNPCYRYVNGNGNGAFGVRVLVSIPLDSYVKNEPIAERTVTKDGMTCSSGKYGEVESLPSTIQTYNVWELR